MAQKVVAETYHDDDFDNYIPEEPVYLNELVDTSIAKIENKRGGKPAKKEAPLLSFLQYKDLAGIPKPEFMIEGLFRSKGIHYIIAPPKSGKTFYTVDHAIRVSFGMNTIDGRQTKQTKVLYIAAEDIENVAERFTAWALHHGYDDIPNIYIYPEPLQITTATPTLIRTLKEKYPDVGLIIFDTQSACTRGVNENQKNEWDVVFKNLGLLWRDVDCALWIVHHEGLSGRMRGTTDMEAEAITVVSLSKNQRAITVTCKYARSNPFDNIVFLIESQKMPYLDNFGKDVYTGVLSACDEETSIPEKDIELRNVLSFLINMPDGARNKEIKDHTGLNDNKLSNVLKGGENRGDLKSTGKGKSKRYYHSRYVPVATQDDLEESSVAYADGPLPSEVVNYPDDVLPLVQPMNRVCYVCASKGLETNWMPFYNGQIWLNGCATCSPIIIESKGEKW